MYAMTFLFESAPSLEQLFDALQSESEAPLRLDHRGEGDGVVWVDGETDADAHAAGVVIRGARVSVQCSMWSSIGPLAQRGLPAIGGVHPVPVPGDEPNPDYGEHWLGLLAEGDDMVFGWKQRCFVLWSGHFDEAKHFRSFEEPYSAPWLEAVENKIWDHMPFDVDVAGFLGGLEPLIDAAAEGPRAANSVVALRHLCRFLGEARAASVPVVCSFR